MRARGVAGALAILLFLSLFPFPGLGQTVKDDLGQSFPYPLKPPERIISLAPNITEILFALGLGDSVVGVTRYCDFPEAARLLPKVGGLVDPNIETILSLEPGLVIAFRGNPLRFLSRLRDLGLSVFVLDIGSDLGSLFPLVEKIGRITGMTEAAGELNDSMKGRIERVARSVGAIREKPRVFIMLYGQGLWTCGAESYLDSLLSIAGAVNVAARVPKKWFLYTRERLVKDNPDTVLILTKSDEDFTRARGQLETESFYRDLEAVRNGRIFRLDEDAASRFGPRLVDVLAGMTRLLHPGLAGDVR